MAYIEVGAVTPQGGQFPSKAQIKRSWAADPASVIFVSVSSVASPGRGTAFNGPVTCPADLPSGTKLTIVGPDPERARNYYGTVEVRAGKVKIS